jgi:hypothetical protein
MTLELWLDTRMARTAIIGTVIASAGTLVWTVLQLLRRVLVLPSGSRHATRPRMSSQHWAFG